MVSHHTVYVELVVTYVQRQQIVIRYASLSGTFSFKDLLIKWCPINLLCVSIVRIHSCQPEVDNSSSYTMNFVVHRDFGTVEMSCRCLGEFNLLYQYLTPMKIAMLNTDVSNECGSVIS